MMYLTAEHYRHFVPVAPPKSYYVPYYDAARRKTYVYDFVVDDSGVVVLPSFFNKKYNGTISLISDGFVLKKDDYLYDSFYLTLLASYSNQKYTETVNGIDVVKSRVIRTAVPPAAGSVGVLTMATDRDWEKESYR